MPSKTRFGDGRSNILPFPVQQSQDPAPADGEPPGPEPIVTTIGAVRDGNQEVSLSFNDERSETTLGQLASEAGVSLPEYCMSLLERAHALRAQSVRCLGRFSIVRGDDDEK